MTTHDHLKVVDLNFQGNRVSLPHNTREDQKYYQWNRPWPGRFLLKRGVFLSWCLQYGWSNILLDQVWGWGPHLSFLWRRYHFYSFACSGFAGTWDLLQTTSVRYVLPPSHVFFIQGVQITIKDFILLHYLGYLCTKVLFPSLLDSFMCEGLLGLE